MASGQLTLDKKTKVLEGSYVTYRHDLHVVLEPTGDAPTPANNLPTHNVYVKAMHGKLVRVGAAWSHKGERGRTAGMTFYSISIDDDDLKCAFSAFPAFDANNRVIEGRFDCVPQRTRQAAA